MIHQNWQDALINSAYLSEQWAVRHILVMKERYPEKWTNGLDLQLEDELRHSRIIKAVLTKHSPVVVDNLKFSMQENLYKGVCGLRPQFDIHATSFEAFTDLMWIMERRALWIYFVYNRIGSNPDYKKVFKSIIEDEKTHVHEKPQPSPYFNIVSKADNYLFTNFIPQTWTQNSFTNEGFWDWYYSGYEAESVL